MVEQDEERGDLHLCSFRVIKVRNNPSVTEKFIVMRTKWDRNNFYDLDSMDNTIG